MKLIIFSVLTILVFLPTSHAGIEAFIHPVCSKNPLAYSPSLLINCPAKFPEKALSVIFDKEIEQIRAASDKHDFDMASMHKSVKLNSSVRLSRILTMEHAFYVKTSIPRNKIIQVQQGLEGSGCFYKYDIVKNSSGQRFCNAQDPVGADKNCLTVHARDPLKNPKNFRKDCDEFLEAMLSCSKDDTASENCGAGLHRLTNKRDEAETPRPNPHNKPMPTTDGDPTGKAVK